MSQLKSPKILTTNRLLDGVVVFFSGKDWQEDISQAAVANTQEELTELEQVAHDSVSANVVIDYYAIDVKVEDKHIEPVAIREKIRVSGPTIEYMPGE